MDDFERTIRQFLAHIDVERGLSKATVSAYGADLKKYRQWLADQGVGGIAAVTTQDVERYIVFLDESGESSRSKARRLASIHALHRFAVNEHIVVDDVSAQVKAPKGVSTLPDVLTRHCLNSCMRPVPACRRRAVRISMMSMWTAESQDLWAKALSSGWFPSAAMRAKRSSGICMRGVLSWNPNRKVPWNGVPYF